MTDEHIEKIKSEVEAADHIPPEKKAEISTVLAKLKPAIAHLEQTHPEHAQNIGRFVEASAHHAAREEKHPELKTVLGRLKESVQKFEASHPKLVASVNDYSTVLSSMGV